MKKKQAKKSSSEKNKKVQKVRKISDKITKKIKGGRGEFSYNSEDGGGTTERQSIGNCWGPCG